MQTATHTDHRSPFGGKGEKVIIFSAPSGSGKTTLVKHCLENFPELAFSISCTTRNPREAFVEFEEVYEDKYYGTLKSEVERIWSEGKTVIFDVDVKGGISLKKYFGEKALSIFIMPPSIEELERRLISRATDDAETIQTRVEKAAHEMTFQNQFDKIVVNNNLDEAKSEISKLVQEFLNA